MMKLSDLLPTPSMATEESNAIRRDPWFRGRLGDDSAPSQAIVVREPPPYGQRTGFKPKTPEDFGDGGAFPEVHMAQFPFGMGLGQREAKNAKTVALQYDQDGKLRHDAIARVGVDKNKIVHTKLADMKAKAWDEDDEDLQKPDEEEQRMATEATRQALEKLTQSKISSALPVQHAQKVAPAQYIRYTPAQQGGGHASGSQQRIIRMVEMQKDPMEPPKFKINQKIPMAPPSPPPPVMHSPPRKVTQKEAADWKIPPCISNWKNPKGFTVALDKRLAADGRGLQQQHINENFAKLSEALYIADRKARESVDARANLERRLAQNKKTEQEAKMREMAQKARQERAAGGARNKDDEDEDVQKRAEIRRDRMDDIRKERNIARSRPDKADKLRREKERDISEKIAIGLPDSKARGTAGETQFDQRLFDQSKGLDSGAMDDETYNAYDKPWRAADNITQHIYRPGKHLDQDVYGDDLDKIVNQKRFVPDKGFSGADQAARGAGPVQFERAEAAEDLFGLDTLFSANKAGAGDKRSGSSRDDRESKRRRDRIASTTSSPSFRVTPTVGSGAPVGGHSAAIPLKLRLGKKSGRYDLSQEVYVLAVNIGDRLIIQCTLTTESTGRECIEYIRHKKELNQIGMFGLRFQTRSSDPDERVFRWVEMDKPLRKQLEKWSCKPRQVQLAVLYHTPNAFILTDLMARSYYFLMMKLDVVEGRLTVDMDNYISLAAYSLQAEYGEYEETVHTIDFMQTIPLLPKHICRSTTILETLLKRVSQVYSKLRGMKSEYAALMYIVDVMQCEGYGEEYFKAKDEDSSEVKLGYSPEGIIVKGVLGAPLKYKWDEIKEFSAHKRHLVIKTKDLSVEYSLEDAERARYVCMVLNWQFNYATHEAIEERNVKNDINDLQGGFRAFTSQHHLSNSDVNSTRVNASQSDLLAAMHSKRASSSFHLHSSPSLHKPSSYSLTNVHSINLQNPDRKPPPLSSVSFRHPVNVVVTPERTRAATSALLPSPISSIISNPNGSNVHLYLNQPPDTPTIPLWHPNIVEDKNASYKAILPNAVEIGAPINTTSFPNHPNHQDIHQRKMMGSTPEMRQLGTRTLDKNSERLLEIMLKQQRPSFQSTPNLVDSTALVVNLNMPIPPEPEQIAPQPSSASRQNLVSSRPVSGLRLPHQDSQETQATTSTASSQMRLYEDTSNQGSSRHTLLNGIQQKDGEVLGEAKEVMTSLIYSRLNASMDSMSREFLMIPNKRITAGTTTSIKPENLHRNRTRCIVPYEDNRLMLRPSKRNPCGYVNASNVEVLLGGQKLQYILAQAPMRDTVDDFWAAVWEANVYVIVMLSEATLDASPNAPIYWPCNANSKVETRDLEVRFKSLSATENEVTTVLELRHSSGLKRTVYHMRFVGWPTGGIPHESALLSFIDSVSSMHRHVDGLRLKHTKDNGEPQSVDPKTGSRSKSVDRHGSSTWKKRLNSISRINIHHLANSSDDSSDSGAPPSPGKEPPPSPQACEISPLLVHCYSGAHESGVYLLADVLIFCLEHNLKADMPTLLGKLRAQRMSLVKTVEQYRFVYSLLSTYLGRSRLI